MQKLRIKECEFLASKNNLGYQDKIVIKEDIMWSPVSEG